MLQKEIVTTLHHAKRIADTYITDSSHGQVHVARVLANIETILTNLTDTEKTIVTLYDSYVAKLGAIFHDVVQNKTKARGEDVVKSASIAADSISDLPEFSIVREIYPNLALDVYSTIIMGSYDYHESSGYGCPEYFPCHILSREYTSTSTDLLFDADVIDAEGVIGFWRAASFAGTYNKFPSETIDYFESKFKKNKVDYHFEWTKRESDVRRIEMEYIIEKLKLQTNV
jgi:hypothetical protein